MLWYSYSSPSEGIDELQTLMGSFVLTAEERAALSVFESVRFLDLRHTFTTMMGERGVPPQVLQAMVGHISARMVRYYTHISNRAAREAVELLDNSNRDTFVGKLVGESKTHKS